MRENAFTTILGEDYELLKFSYPHHDEFQSTVASQIKNHYSEQSTSEIKVLEGGAGSGVTTSFLLEADERIKIWAVDNSAAMLDQAITILSGSAQRVEFIESDLLAYVKNQADQSFDVFVAVWTLHNIPPDTRKAIFTELARILKPGGLFVSGDKYTVDNLNQHQQQLEVQLQRFREFPSKDPAIVQAWVTHNLEDEEIRISEKEQLLILEEIGFKEVKTVYRKDMEAIIIGARERT